MLPLPGGRTPAAGAVQQARQASDGKAERRFETLLDRAVQLLGDRAKGNLAVSNLQSADPGLFQGILRGQTVKDVDLHQALVGALGAGQGDRPVAPPAPPAPPPAGGIDEERVAAAVHRVLLAMAPTLVAAAVQELRGGAGVAAA